jgi:alpha-tubulin suppressor-like RCC1 family protein
MFGAANEGRLGVVLHDIVEEEEIPQGEAWQMQTKSLQLVQFPDPMTKILKVCCGSSFTLVLSESGLLYSWGFGKSGSLGLGEKSFCPTPN